MYLQVVECVRVYFERHWLRFPVHAILWKVFLPYQFFSEPFASSWTFLKIPFMVWRGFEIPKRHPPRNKEWKITLNSTLITGIQQLGASREVLPCCHFEGSKCYLYCGKFFRYLHSGKLCHCKFCSFQSPTVSFIPFLARRGLGSLKGTLYASGNEKYLTWNVYHFIESKS